MKNSIKLAALLMLATTGVFAATPAKTTEPAKDEITVQSSAKNLLVGVSIQKETAGRAYVTFYDNNHNQVMTDFLPKNASVEKVYNLAELPYGTYTMAVASNKQVITKQIQVYKEFGKKTYVFLQ
ncbi:hypothetical protein [Mucilaginibacter pedocola]|uniref:Secretion system C-terminal sorting domain-containing protein n=1 Tax=Mucilaginibacter pedocola TaxID=1792845 RepID=A0A1S9PLS7_9SPHI|nr:hypothetical protein [Mucilaginibacter pedocola]OOQ61894.1 hypothetical protein BC343_02185 [Mucilaginibacter pedocola]